MSAYDRLSALMARFTLSVTPCAAEAANLIILQDPGSQVPTRILLTARGDVPMDPAPNLTVLFSAEVAWGGPDNPLFSALPGLVAQDIAADGEMALLVNLLSAEHQAQRCGSASVLNRLGEVLIVRLLRAQIEEGTAAPGLLGGLSDPRLSRAIVAIHEQPDRPWRNDDLARVAGLSVSRFAELFQKAVGQAPAGYLRRWRLVLAKQDIERGDRVQAVARRYCYGSTEALNRAFHQAHGENPMSLRKKAREKQSAMPAA